MSKSPLFQMAAGIVNATAALHRKEIEMSDRNDSDDRWLAEFDRLKKAGKVVLDREEWRDKLEDAYRDGRSSMDRELTQAYADGRADEREQISAARATPAEPLAWLFQHDETGRMVICPNDGVNTVESFAKANPRLLYVAALGRVEE